MIPICNEQEVIEIGGALEWKSPAGIASDDCLRTLNAIRMGNLPWR
jgi:hypothetical protein